MKMKQVLFALAIGLASASWVVAQPASTSPAAVAPVAPASVRDVSSLIGPIIEKHGVPGMAVAVVIGGEMVAHGCGGIRKNGEVEKIAITDLFHLGSCTKSMTATMIATLVEEGKLKWETTVGEVFADVPMHQQWKSVRLEQLLTNSSGAPNGLDKDGLWERLWLRKGTPMEQRRTLVVGVLKNEPEVEPGTRFVYSNAGFAIAGAMAETVTGVPWEDLMQERLFKPLGMESAGYGPPGKRGSIDQPRGHRENGTGIEPGRDADNPPAIGPAGTVHCTIDDWAKYIALHVQGARGTPRIVKAETFTKLHTPMKLAMSRSDYAMGWGTPKRGWARGKGPDDAGRVLTHNGSNNMWFCVTWIAPEKGFAVLVACNKAGNEAAAACDEMSQALIKVAAEQLPPPAPSATP